MPATQRFTLGIVEAIFFYMSDAILGFQSTMSESRKAATVSCYNIMTILDVADDILLILC